VNDTDPRRQERVSFYTLGCRLNNAETALIAERFREAGYEIVAHGAAADVAVINTCSVTERADARCRNEIRKIRRRSPEALVCAVGCYSQADTETVAGIEGVDLVVGTDRKFELAKLIQSREDADGPVLHISARPDSSEIDYPVAGYYPHQTRANVKIQDGCDFCCAYCILPRVRGKAYSRRLEDVIAEGHELAQRGHKELVISGVNIGTYRSGNATITDIARGLSEIPGVARVRVSSIEPTTVEDDLLAWMASDPKACRHLHLPLQAGDDAVLTRMQRVYTVAGFARFIEKAKVMMPDLGVGTDIIAGHPGEGEAEFANTLRFVEEMPFSYLHIFSYSERPKTAAAFGDGKNSPQTVKERSDVLHELAARKKKAFFKEHGGRTVEVLFESVDGDGWRKGFTGSYLRVGIQPGQADENQLKSVTITGSRDDFCVAI
jgi:threonylcarbamoyladenosine tRNA methylthiotransferase MtaB